MLRENRNDIDLVRDNVEEQLHKEVEVIEGIKALLQQKVTESFEQLCLLQEARHQLHCDLTDKCHAIDIDGKCHELNNSSEEIDFQINPTRTVKGSVTPNTWNAFSQYNKYRGEAEMGASQRLREAIFATLEKTKNDLEAQRKATEYEFRKRIHETEQAKDELEWQQKKTKDEISTLDEDIEALQQAINAKMAPMKVTQSRLENRTKRRNIELCRDIPQYQLCYELGEIDGSIKTLLEKLEVAESGLRNLQKDLARIEHDLYVKTNSLSLDNGCMETRVKLVVCDELVRNEVEVDAISKGVEQLTSRDEKDERMKEKVGEVVKFKDVSHSPRVSFSLDVDTNTNPYLRSTYDADFEEFKCKRSADLHRTLGNRPTNNAVTENTSRDVLYS